MRQPGKMLISLRNLCWSCFSVCIRLRVCMCAGIRLSLTNYTFFVFFFAFSEWDMHACNFPSDSVSHYLFLEFLWVFSPLQWIPKDNSCNVQKQLQQFLFPSSSLPTCACVRVWTFSLKFNDEDDDCDDDDDGGEEMHTQKLLTPHSSFGVCREKISHLNRNRQLQSLSRNGYCVTAKYPCVQPKWLSSMQK